MSTLYSNSHSQITQNQFLCHNFEVFVFEELCQPVKFFHILQTMIEKANKKLNVRLVFKNTIEIFSLLK